MAWEGSRRGARRAGRYRVRALPMLLSGGLLVAVLTSSGQWSSTASLGPLMPAAAMLRTTQLDTPTMQSVNAPARVARVAEVPDSGIHEAWAIGYTHGDVAGSASDSALGQIVFLHYVDGSGWQVAGPPTVASGAVSNKRLFDLSLGPSGEGWAVGEGGVLVHHPSGSSTWQVVQGPSTATLESVSVVPDGGGIAGYAVGGVDPQTGSPTVLHLAGGTWTSDNAGVAQTGTNQPGLTGVAAVSSDEAWAVSGEAAQASTAAISVQALYVFHRTGGQWHRVSTQSMFDQPPATANDTQHTTIEAAIGGAVAANSLGAWVVGRLVPNQTNTLLGDQLTGDRSRPFAIWIPKSESPVDPYCPAIEQVSSSGAPQDDTICAGNFPLAAFGLDSAVIPPNASVVDGRPELFAGGMGLFHYVHNSWNATTSIKNWVREPDPIGYIASISLASSNEGWVAGTGSNAIGGGPFSETLALGHWTKQATLPAVDRWPDPSEYPVEAVALAPNGSHGALGVGQNATRLHYVPGTGWILQHVGGEDLHALAWPVMGSAWAVGNRGALGHYDGNGWTFSSAPRTDLEAAPANLFGVAFAGAGTGWAVGANGTVLDYRERWRLDGDSGTLTGGTLYTVATVPGGAVAAGEGGAVLVSQGGTWRVDGQAEQLLTSLKKTNVTFYASASLPDGTAAIAGSGGVVLVRSAAGAWRDVEPGLDGSVIALGLVRGGDGSLRYLASVDPKSSPKYVAGNLAATQGWVFVGDGTSWQDIELNHAITMWSATDTAAPRDPVLSFALEPGAVRGWATGGYPQLTVDDENHAYESGTSTGSLYRLDLGSDPSPPSVLTAAPPPPGNGFTFAFLGDSACAAGLCGAAMGSGTAADVAFLQAKQEISAVHPDLTIYGGNMRGTGLPEELAAFKRYVSNWPTPFYAAMGSQDLMPINSSTPSTSTSSCTGAATEGNGYYLQAFADAPGPWGSGSTPPGVHTYDPPGTPMGTTGEARTHYSFDYTPPDLGQPQARFVILNDSDGCTTDTQGNPSPAQTGTNAAQSNWLGSILSNANQAKLPTIVVMNQPAQDPRNPASTTGTGGSGFLTSFANGVPSALFSSYFNDNMSYGVSVQAQQLNVSLPAYISGGAGSPFDSQYSHNPLHGYYHAWLLATVDTNPADRTALGQAPVTVQAFPILESVAMTIAPRVGSSEDVIPAGTPATVQALGRSPDEGLPNLNGPSPDPAQTKAQYIQVPNRLTAAPPCPPSNKEAINCSAPYSIQPYRYFWSETPDVADFVKPCPDPVAPIQPCLDGQGQMISDHDDGFLCILHPGTAWIDVLVGTHRARQMISVGPGTGDCNKHPLPKPQPDKPPVVQPPPNPVSPVLHPAAVIPAPAPRLAPHRFFHTVFQNNLVPAVIPPPVPVVAAAPPLPAAGTAAKKEEEREKALEHSKESGGQTHQAVAYLGAQSSWDYRPLATAGAGVFGMFIVSAAWAASRRRSAAAIDVRRWE